jgi:NAD(P)H-hydrate epimerase
MRITELRDELVRLPKRKAETHKGDYGRVLIVGGSVGYTGAPTLCARAAVRSGAGLVYLGVPETIYTVTAVKNDEAMPFPLPADGAGRLSPDALRAVAERLRGCDVCAAGPGLGKGEGTAALVRYLLEHWEKPLVLDADGLNMLARQTDVLKAHRGPVVLTPHDGEFRRLGGKLDGDRALCAADFAAEYGCILVLKGHRTLVAFPDGQVFRCSRGNPGMAKGGSGDVLTGVIAALLGQFPPEQAVPTAVQLHALAGDLCAAAQGEYAMTATDLIETLPAATKQLMTDR